jgi:hypothetical protein
MASKPDDPAQVSDQTLRTFESGLPAPDAETPVAHERREQRAGVMILAGMAVLIVVGLAVALNWVL